MYKLPETQQTPIAENYFGNWIKTIPVGDYREVRKRIISECKITEQVFRFWRGGITKVPILAQPIVNEIAGKNIFKTKRKNRRKEK